MKSFVTIIFSILIFHTVIAQVPRVRRDPVLNSNIEDKIISKDFSSPVVNPNNVKKSSDPKNDSLGFEHRDDSKDIISINYHFLDAKRIERCFQEAG